MSENVITKNKAKKDTTKLINLMVEKSQESLLLAIELYNKPTITLNIEGFVIFACNAWELLLKAHLLNIGESIYYKKSFNKNRTLALDALIKKVMTNQKDNVRLNLEIISGIRNSAVHLIIPEYSLLLNDLFLSCIRNYVDKLYKFFSININDKIKTDFLTLHIPYKKKVDIMGKYGKEVYQKYYDTSTFITKTLATKGASNGIVPEELAMSYQITFKKVNNLDEADLKVYNSKQLDSIPTITIEKAVDSRVTHPHSTKKVISLINEQMERDGISFNPYTKSGNTKFTSDTFSLFCKKKDIKNNSEYAYLHVVGNNKNYTYSTKLVQYIINSITDDPDIFVKLKKA